MQRIDNLKESKACLKNDFSLYKRSFTLARAKIDTSELISEEVSKFGSLLLPHPLPPNTNPHPRLINSKCSWATPCILET